MKWRKLGKVWAPDGSLAWARTHAFVPTPHVVPGSHISIYCTSLDDLKIGRVGRVDVDLDDPTRVLRTWSKPVFDIGAPGAFDCDGVNASSVLERDGVLYLYYIGWQRSVRVPYTLFGGIAASTDGGETFERVLRVPVIDRTTEEPFSRSAPHVIADEGILRMWYWSCREWTLRPGLEPHYNNEISYAESNDGLNWSGVRPGILRAGPSDYSVGRPWVIRDDRGYHMWIATRSHSTEEPYRISYAHSSDGFAWTESDAGIQRSAEGWDSEMQCFAAVVDTGSRRFMFYNGNRHGSTGFGVAELESE